MPLTQPIPTIFVVSGGVGASGEQLVRTMLAQFPEDAVRVVTIGNVRRPEQIEEVIQQAQPIGALVAFTLVDISLREYLLQRTGQLNVDVIDLMGPLIGWVSDKTGLQPSGQPGLYRQLHRDYYDRIAAIEYAMAHDDGKNAEGWPQAEAVLVGVSRAGKTPISLYLAVLGWKVANYPLVPQLPVDERLFSLDPKRVIGLTIDPDQLLQFRQARQRRLGTTGASAYVDPEVIYDEIKAAMRIFRRGKFKIIDMTDKTIEMGADEIIQHLQSLR